MAKKQKTFANITGTLTTSGNTTITSVSAGSGIVYNANSGSVLISTPKSTYHILGEDVEVSGYKDGITAMMVATLNVLGKPFLDELHKNNTFFPKEIEEYLEKKLKWFERDKKIDDIINKDLH
jgi:hypothetical protein